MIHLSKFTLALPFAFAVAACSSNRSSGDTGTAAGTIANDTAAVRMDTNPVPGVRPDTSKKLVPTDTTMKDTMAMDSTKKDSTRHHRASKKSKKPY